MSIPISQLPSDLVNNGQLDVSNPAKQNKYNQLNDAYNASNSGGGSSAPAQAPQVASIWDNPDQLNTYLANYQKDVLSQLGVTDSSGSNTPTPKPATDASGNPVPVGAPDTVGASTPTSDSSQPLYTQIASALTPNTDMPAPLNRTDLFNTYRQQYGVDGLESHLTDLKTQSDALAAQTRVNVAAEQGKTVATNIIEGRVSVQKQQAQDQMDFIDRQINTVTDQLNTAYKVIGMYMNFASLDYQDAVTRYNTEFDQSMQIFSMLRSVRTDALSELSQKTSADFQQAGLDLQYQQAAQDNARANLQIMTNAITNGNLDPSSLSPDQQAQMSKLEVQSGLPIGFVSSLGLSNKDKIISTSTNNGVTQVLTQDANGTISVKNYGTSTKQPTAGDKTTAISTAVVQKLNSTIGADGFTNENTFKTAEQWYVSQGGNRNDFISNYIGYVNPAKPADYGVPDSLVNPDKYKPVPIENQ